MKTIKVIDLLNMIANKEYDKLPKKVKYDDIIYECMEDCCGDIWYRYLLNGSTKPENVYDLLGDIHLNYGEKMQTVLEIIEDTPNKIEKIEIYRDRIKAPSTGNFAYSISVPQKIIIQKVNEIIDRLNEVKND